MCYCRLQDSYDTTIYREAFLMGGYDLENILNKFGRCTITFSCKPQKYLITGDTPISIPAGSTTTYTGSSVQFDGISGARITSLSTTITPTQDLHGYASPWPAGGGDNKFEPFSGTHNGITFTVQDDGTVKITGNATSTTWTTVNQYVDLPWNGINAGDTVVLWSDIYFVVGSYEGPTLISNKSSQNGVANSYTIPSNATRLRFYEYAKSTVPSGGESFDVIGHYYFAKANSFSLWTPYSNICPISGRTGLSVYRTGINLWDEEWELGTLNWSTGANETSTTRIRSKNYIPCVGEAVYYVRIPTSAVYIFYYDADNNFISYLSSSKANETFTTPSNARYIRFFTASNAYGTTYNNDISINYPATDTDYHAYNGNTYAVDWTTQAGTVYGGTLDVVSGVLTVDTVKLKISDLTWDYTNDCFRSENIMAGGLTGNVVACDSYAVANQATPTADRADMSINFGATGSAVRRIYIKDSRYDSTTISAWQTAMGDAEIVRELVNPLTYQLTPQAIGVLTGANYVWLSDGNVSLTVTTPLGGIVTNPTPFEARPMLTVSGLGEITINGKSIQILESVSDFDIDCEAMEAEDNSKIYCMDFPELSGGENEIVGDGSITSLTVVPRWWTL